MLRYNKKTFCDTVLRRPKRNPTTPSRLIDLDLYEVSFKTVSLVKLWDEDKEPNDGLQGFGLTIGVTWELYRDNEKENGNYYLGLGSWSVETMLYR